jgi:hypothetical protein
MFGFGKKNQIPATQIRVKCNDEIPSWFTGLEYEHVEPWRSAHLCKIGSKCHLSYQGEVMILNIVGLEPSDADVYLTRDTQLIVDGFNS